MARGRSTHKAGRSLFRSAVVGLCCLSLVFLPMRRSEAFLAPAGVVPVLVGSAGPIVWTVAALAAAAAAGIAIWRLTLRDASNADVVDINLNPKATARVPSGWTAAVPGFGAPVPPATASSITQYKGFNISSIYDDTQQAAADRGCAAAIRGTGVLISGLYNDCTTHYSGCGSGALGNCVQMTSQVVCPTGYTLSAGVCNLTSAPSVPYPSDAVGKIDLSGGAFAGDSRDPDNALPAPVTNSGTVVKAQVGTGTLTVTANGDGTVSITTTVGNGDGTSTRITLQTKAPNGGATDGGTNASGVTVGTVTGEGSQADANTPTTVNCLGGPCATEATQIANKMALQSIDSNGVQIKEQASSWATAKSTADSSISTLATTAATVSANFDAAKTGGVGAVGVTGMGELTVPTAHEQGSLLHALFPAAASCAPVTFAGGVVFGSSSGDLVVDICPVVAVMKPIVEWLVYGLTLFYLYGVFWRRRQAPGA